MPCSPWVQRPERNSRPGRLHFSQHYFHRKESNHKFLGPTICGCQFSCFTCFIPQEIETWSWLRWVDGLWVDFVISNLSGSGATLPSTGSPVHCHYGAGVDCAKSQTWDGESAGAWDMGQWNQQKLAKTGYLEVFIAAKALQMFVFNQFHRNERIETCQQNS